MDKKKPLGSMAESDKGKPKSEAGWRLLSSGLSPLLAMLATFFPSLSHFLFSWLQPAMETLKEATDYNRPCA